MTAEDFARQNLSVLNRFEMCGLVLIICQLLLTLLECLGVYKRSESVFDNGISETVFA
jgi:hypothetical protein